MSKPALRLVDTETGELHENCPECQHHTDTIAGLNRKMNGMAAEITALRRDRAQDARDHPLWGLALEKFALWQRVCRHPKSEWTADRFWLVEPHLSGRDGSAVVDGAIYGAGYDSFQTKRRNGSMQRHDSWELIFRDRGKVEEFCNRAPRNRSDQDSRIGGSSVGAAPRERPAPGTPAQTEASR